jgi:hypothetical protein
VDWSLACLGNSALDLGLFLPGLASEGGPAPESILPNARGIAAWVSGFLAVHASKPQVSGPAPGHRSYASFLSFRDPDGNGWVLQEVTTRLAGRVDPALTTFSSSRDLAEALRRASAAHGRHEAKLGRPDPDWPSWYAEHMVHEQSGDTQP